MPGRFVVGFEIWERACVLLSVEIRAAFRFLLRFACLLSAAVAFQRQEISFFMLLRRPNLLLISFIHFNAAFTIAGAKLSGRDYLYTHFWMSFVQKNKKATIVYYTGPVLCIMTSDMFKSLHCQQQLGSEHNEKASEDCCEKNRIVDVHISGYFSPLLLLHFFTVCLLKML